MNNAKIELSQFGSNISDFKNQLLSMEKDLKNMFSIDDNVVENDLFEELNSLLNSIQDTNSNLVKCIGDK